MSNSSLHWSGHSLENLTVSGDTCAIAVRKRIYVLNLNKPEIPTAKLEATVSRWIPGMVQLEFNPHSSKRKILASTSNAEVHVWDIEAAKQLHSWKLYAKPISGMNWSSTDPNLLATCADSREMKVIDARTGKASIKLTSAFGASRIQWNPHYSNVLASAHGGNVKIWDSRMVAVTNTIMAHTAKITSLEWCPIAPDEFVTAGSSQHDQSVKLWSLEFPRESRAHIRQNNVYMARYTPFGRGLLTSKRNDNTETPQGPLLWSLDSILNDSDLSPVMRFRGDHLFHWWSRQTDDTHIDYSVITWNSTLGKLEIKRIDAETHERVHSAVSTNKEEQQQHQQQQQQQQDQVKKKSLIPTTGGIQSGKTLSQEFYEMKRKRVTGVTLTKTDEVARTCEVTFKSRSRDPKIGVINLQVRITFPSLYPNNAPPSFHFIANAHPNSSLASLQMKLKEELSNLADIHVNANKPCLKASIELITEALSKATPLSYANVTHGKVTTVEEDPASYLLARSAGAVFCGVGKLVIFSNNFGARKLGNKPVDVAEVSDHNEAAETNIKKQTGQGISLSRYFFRNRWPKQKQSATAVDVEQSASSTLRQPNKQSGVRTMTPNAVVVVDLSPLLLLSPNIGRDYQLASGASKSVVTACETNRDVVNAKDRPDLIRAWSLTLLIMRSCVMDRTRTQMSSLHAASGARWAGHPCGGKALQRLIEFYLDRRDFQTVSALAYVASTTIIATTGQADVKQSLLEPQVLKRVGWAHYLYSDVLYRWGHFTASAAVRKAGLTAIGVKQKRVQKSLENTPIFQTICPLCAERGTGVICNHNHLGRGEPCKGRTNTCCVCRNLNRTQTVFCVECGHGGHPKCVQDWTELSDFCATGCGCECNY